MAWSAREAKFLVVKMLIFLECFESTLKLSTFSQPIIHENPTLILILVDYETPYKVPFVVPLLSFCRSKLSLFSSRLLAEFIMTLEKLIRHSVQQS